MIPNFSLAGSVLSRKHGLATFVHERLEWSLVDQSSEQSETEWLCVDVIGYKIIDVYKTSTFAIHTNSHPDVRSVPTPQSACWWLQLPACQLGLQQNISWRWEPGLLGNIQQPWTVAWPKGNSQFLLSPMELRHQPRPGFREFRPGQPTAGQTCSRKFPQSQHRPSLITPPRLKVPAHTATRLNAGTFARLIGSAFAFSQVNPLRDCHLWTHQIFRGHTRIFARAYYLWPNNASHVAVGRTMWHARTKSARPSIAPSSESQWGLTLINPLRPYFLSSNRRSRSNGSKLSTTSTSRTLAARRGAPSTNSLAGLDAPLACAPSRKTPPKRLTSEKRSTQDQASTSLVNKQLSDLWKISTPEGNSISETFRSEELAAALRRLKPESLQNWIRSSRSLYSTPGKLSNRGFAISSLLHAPTQNSKDLEKSTNSFPKPEKSQEDPKSYNPIPLSCVPFKILERLIYTRVEPIIAFRPKRRPELCLSTSQQPTTPYGTVATLASNCDCCLIDTWSARSWRWLAIAVSPLPPETTNGAGCNALRTASHRDLSWRPFSSTSTSLTCQTLSRDICTCWRPSNHACWWRLAGSGRGADQGHGKHRWIPPDMETKAQHYKNGVSSLPSYQEGS